MRRRKPWEGELHVCLPGRDKGGSLWPGLRRKNGGMNGWSKEGGRPVRKDARDYFNDYFKNNDVKKEGVTGFKSL